MELNKIRIILDDLGGIDSLITPVINQYATNYLIEVAFKNEYEDNRIYKVVFNINGKESPAKVLAPTDRYYDFEDGTRTAHFWEYKLTQYETQFYQDVLEFSLIVENEAGVITTQKIALVMSKQRFNKLTPVNLENDTSLNSVVYSISNLDKIIDSRINTSETEILEEVNRLDGVVRTDLTNRIMSEIDTVHTRIDGVEDYYNSEISRIDADINEKESNLYNEITNAVNAATRYTDNTVNAYDDFAQGYYLIKSDIPTEIYPYVDNKHNDSLKYTDDKIADLVGTAPETLDTLKEIADALKDQDDVITAIETTIGEKADRSDLDGKVDKIVYSNQVYITDSGGYQSSISYSEYEAQGGTIPVRNSGGNIAVGETPYADNDAASKKYVDELVVNKVNTPNRVYITDSSGNQATKEYIMNTPKAGVFPIYNAYGRLTSYNPVERYEVVNKQYLDGALSGSVIELSETAIAGLNMTNNTQYKCLSPITSLDIDGFIAGDTGTGEQWSIIFSTSTTITVSLPDTVKWAVAEPVFNPNKTYMLTFIRFLDNYLGIWTVA